MYRKGHLSSMLQHIAELWHNVESSEMDELGQYPIVPTLIGNVYCAVVPQTGSLLSGRMADTTLSRTTHKIVIRYRADIKPDMWLVIEGQRYDILYILDPYLNKERLEIFCEVKI